MKLLLTSPSGKLGGSVLQNILDHDLVPASSLILSTTSPHKVQAIAKQNDIPIVSGNYSDPRALRQSWSSIQFDILFLVSYPSANIERWELHKNAIDAAVSAGVKLIVYTSLMFGGTTGMDSVADVMQAHIQTIRYLQSHRIDHVILRMGIYAEYWNVYAGFLPSPLNKNSEDEKVEAVIPADGKVAWIAIEDLGEATARILTALARGERRNWINTSLNLTGPNALSVAEVCEMVSRRSGVNIRVKITGKEEAQKYHLHKAREAGREEWLVHNWLTWGEALSQGECGIVDGLTQKVLHRKARGMEDVLDELYP